MLIIADSSALITLATCQCLPLLDQLFDEVKVPLAVFDEVVIEGKRLANSLQAYLTNKVCPVELRHWVINVGGLGQGELEAMTLYKQLSADYLLIDDKRARKIASFNNINLIGSLGVLLLAKQQGLLSYLKPYLEQIRLADIYISEPLAKKLLKLAGEMDE